MSTSLVYKALVVKLSCGKVIKAILRFQGSCCLHLTNISSTVHPWQTCATGTGLERECVPDCRSVHGPRAAADLPERLLCKRR